MRGHLLLVEDLSRLLGVSTRTIHELTRKRSIPCRRIAGTRRILFDSEEIADWVDAGGAVDLEVIEGRDGGLVVKPKTRPPTELRSIG